jgi:hypothetical protein
MPISKQEIVSIMASKDPRFAGYRAFGKGRQDSTAADAPPQARRPDEPSIEDLELIEATRSLCNDIGVFLADEARLGITQYSGRIRGELVSRYQQAGLPIRMFWITKELQSRGF